jgi:hypothetical protein
MRVRSTASQTACSGLCAAFLYALATLPCDTDLRLASTPCAACEVNQGPQLWRGVVVQGSDDRCWPKSPLAVRVSCHHDRRGTRDSSSSRTICRGSVARRNGCRGPPQQPTSGPRLLSCTSLPTAAAGRPRRAGRTTAPVATRATTTGMVYCALEATEPSAALCECIS